MKTRCFMSFHAISHHVISLVLLHKWNNVTRFFSQFALQEKITLACRMWNYGKTSAFCHFQFGRSDRCKVVVNSPLSQRKRKWSCCAGSWGRISCTRTRNCNQTREKRRGIWLQRKRFTKCLQLWAWEWKPDLKEVFLHSGVFHRILWLNDYFPLQLMPVNMFAEPEAGSRDILGSKLTL